MMLTHSFVDAHEGRVDGEKNVLTGKWVGEGGLRDSLSGR